MNINHGLAAYGFGDYRLAECRLRENVELLTLELARQRFGQALFPAVNSLALLARILGSSATLARESSMVRRRSRWPRRSITRTA